MRREPTVAPEVRPAGELEWRPKDSRWLAGGKRLHVVLGLLLLVLMVVPVRIVEDGQLAGRPDFVSDTQPAAPQVPGIYWRWSLYLEDCYSRYAPHAWADSSPRSPLRDWVPMLLPALMGLALIAGLFLPPSGRAVLLIFAGALPLTDVMSSGRFPLMIVPYGDAAPCFLRRSMYGWTSSGGSLAEAAFFDRSVLLLLLVVAVGAHRGVMRGADGAVRRCAMLAASLLVFMPLAIVALVQIAVRDYDSLLGPEMGFTGGSPALGWPTLALFGTCRTAMFVLGVQSLANGFAADRRIAAAAFIVGAIGLAAGVGIAACEGAEVGLFFQQTDIRYDWMLNAGILLHRLLPPAIGMILVVGGVGRLLVAVSRPEKGGAA